VTKFQKQNVFAICGVFLVLVAAGGLSVASARYAGRPDDGEVLRGRIVAVNIPGASGISAAGQFLPGGPIHDKPALAAFTQPGRVLDPARILVASSSNFGETPARDDELPGSFLSIDPRGDTLVIPESFATTGGQASALEGRVQIFTANNAAFLNGLENPTALTANFTGASNPWGCRSTGPLGGCGLQMPQPDSLASVRLQFLTHKAGALLALQTPTSAVCTLAT